MAPKSKKIRISLGYKFVLLVVTILAITLSTTTGVVIHAQNKIFEDQLTEKGKLLGYFVSLISPEAIFTSDFFMLDNFMKDISQQNDTIYGVIFDPNDNNITNYLNKSNPYIEDAITTVGENTKSVLAHLQQNTSIIHMRFPIVVDDERLGYVLVGVSKQRLKQQANDMLSKLATGNVIIIIFLSACIFLVFRHNVLRPVKVLMQGSNRVSEGNLNESIKLHTQDELGQLTQSFNLMMDRLRNTLQEKDDALNKLQELNRTLEDRVNRRTNALEQSETKIRAILDNIRDGVIAINEQGLIESANPAACSIFSYQLDEMMMLHNIFLISDTHTTPLATLANYSDEQDGLFKVTHSSQPEELQGRRPDNSEFPMEVVVSPMQLGGTRLRVCVVRDISRRKKAEQQLAIAQSQLLEAAHGAGMAEIATGVLHNIRNILNSVNIAGTEIQRIAKNSKIAGLQKANELLKNNLDNLGDFFTLNKKGRLLPEYYVKVADGIESELQQILKESGNLNNKITMMNDVINTQQEYARSGHFSEELTIETLVNDAISVQESSLQKWGVHVKKQLEANLAITVNKSKILQVLTNIVKNAKDAMQENDILNKEKLLQINAEKLNDNYILIKITDNGCGITQDKLTSIFNHGYTTKKDGHGFGLHSCANAMTEIGGSIKVESDGPNTGASFIITLPIMDKQLSAEQRTHEQKNEGINVTTYQTATG